MTRITIKTNKKLLPISIAIALGSFSVTTQAATVTATADYTVGALVAPGDPYAFNDSATSTTTGVDILDGLTAGTTGNSVFYHTYGNQSGSFGARVSGTGVYDITSSITYVDTVFNNTTTAQTYAFDFDIIPGGLSVYGTPSGSDFAFAGYDIEIMFNGAVIFDSAASLNLTTGGTEFLQSGTTIGSLTNVNNYSWGNYSDLLDLGSLAAGTSADLSYRMTTSARGNIFDSVAGTELVTVCEPVFGGDGGEFFGDGGEFEILPPDPVEPANCQVITVPTGGGPGGSTSRSGDPLNIYGTTSSNQYTIINTTPTTSVPEASSMMFMGIGIAGLAIGRRKKIKLS